MPSTGAMRRSAKTADGRLSAVTVPDDEHAVDSATAALYREQAAPLRKLRPTLGAGFVRAPPDPSLAGGQAPRPPRRLVRLSMGRHRLGEVKGGQRVAEVVLAENSNERRVTNAAFEPPALLVWLLVIAVEKVAEHAGCGSVGGLEHMGIAFRVVAALASSSRPETLFRAPRPRGAESQRSGGGHAAAPR